MGWLDKLFGRHDDDGIVIEAETVTIRSADIARLLDPPREPNFTDPATGPCGKCGGVLGLAFITTGGARGDQVVWRDHPVAVDGWACTQCGVFRYPRPMSVDRIQALMHDGAEHGRAGRFVLAEECFARIVWNWPGYFVGHVNYAEATRERLNAEPGMHPQVVRRVTERLVAQYEAAIEAYLAEPQPSYRLPVARAYVTLVEIAIEQRADNRARRLLDACCDLPELPDAVAERVAALSRYLNEGGRAIEEASRELMPYLRLADRPGKAINSGKDRARVMRAIDRLSRDDARASNWRIAWLIGKGHEALGDTDRALEVMRDGIERHVDATDLARDFSLLLLRCARHDEARDVARAIAHEHPDDATLWCNLAVTELLCGEVDASNQALSRSLDIAPDDSIANALRRKIHAVLSGDAPFPASLRELEQG